jgi:hypothetical protein
MHLYWSSKDSLTYEGIDTAQRGTHKLKKCLLVVMRVLDLTMAFIALGQVAYAAVAAHGLDFSWLEPVPHQFRDNRGTAVSWHGSGTPSGAKARHSYFARIQISRS